ncbi:TetR family transcriptional regulator [Nocardia testacea]
MLRFERVWTRCSRAGSLIADRLDATVDEIAKAVGVTRVTLYAHFRQQS